jgi:hypothetical protein
MKTMTLAVAAMVLVFAAPGNAAGPGATTAVFTVGSLTVPGVNTGLVLKKGKVVTVTATGSFCPHGSGGVCFGPGGDASVDTTQSSYGGFPLPGAPAYGLIARVGSDPWIQVGAGPTTLSGVGALVFAVNDDALVDNSGGFVATVSSGAQHGHDTRDCWPGWGHGDKNHEHCGPPGQTKKGSSESSGTSNGNANGHENSNGHGEDNGNGNGNGGGKPPK